MAMQISTKEELTKALAQLQYHSDQMCNVTDIEDIAKNFVIAEDILTSIYRYAVESKIHSAVID